MRYLGQPKVLGDVLGIRSRGSLLYAQYVQSLLNGQSGFWLPLSEASGSIAVNRAYTGGVGAELFTNPGNPFTFTADDPTGWTIQGEVTTNPEVSEVGAGESHGGSGTGYVNIFSTASLVKFYQTPLTIGDTFRSVVNVNKITSGAISRETTGSTTVGNNLSVGENSLDFIATGTELGIKRNTGTGDDATIQSHSVKLVGQLDGAYTGPTLAGTTLLGQPAPTFDGVNDYVQLENNRLESVFDPSAAGFQMTMIVAFKFTAAQRADANAYDVMRIGVDGNNGFIITKSAANNLAISARAGGSSKTINNTLTSSIDSKWSLACMAVNKAADTTECYLNGVAGTPTDYPDSAWTASNMAATFCRVGSVNGLQFFPNAIGQVIAINHAITQAEYTNLYNLFRAQEPNAA